MSQATARARVGVSAAGVWAHPLKMALLVWMALGFHSLLSGSHSSHKDMLSTMRCQVIVEGETLVKGVLFSYLAYIISLQCFLKTYIMHSISISASKGKKTAQIGRR